MLDILKANWKTAAYVVGATLLLYVLIWIFTFKPQIPIEYKHALDSLNRANAELVAKQKQIDSTISAYKGQIDSLDVAIGNIDVKKTEIHNHYQILGDKASKYNAAQIDSFFKVRYNY